MANEIRGVSPSGTLYAHLRNQAGLIWDGSAFETYASGSYADYDLAMTEQGDSGVYLANFPSTITTAGTYEYYVYLQAGGSPAEGDPVIGTGKVDWTGIASAAPSVGTMTGSEFRDYVLRCGFKRTDKDTELYEAVTDAIQEMRRRFSFSSAEAETTTTDTIASLGDFKLDLETDHGLILGIVMEDDETATTLNHISKAEFDRRYPDANVTADRGYPKDFCIYGGDIYLGPIPDSTSYVYRISYSYRAGTVTSGTVNVPFTDVYRDLLADNVLSRLYKSLEEYDKASAHRADFEGGFVLATRRERQNAGLGTFTMQQRDC